MILYTIITGIIAAVWHFLYDIFPFGIVSVIAPVSESIWEHGKIVFYAILLYDIFTNGRIFFANSIRTVLQGWLAVLFMFMLYYTYTGIFGVSLLWVDILISFTSILLSRIHIIHFIPQIKGGWVGIILIILSILVFACATYYYPNLPLFLES